MNKDQKHLLLNILMELELSFKEMKRDEGEFFDIVDCVNDEFELKYFEETANLGSYLVH